MEAGRFAEWGILLGLALCDRFLLLLLLLLLVPLAVASAMCVLSVSNGAAASFQTQGLVQLRKYVCTNSAQPRESRLR